MAFDERDHVQQLAHHRVLKARQQQRTDVRKFVIQQINFEIADYTELISWIDVNVTEPPLLSQISTNENQAEYLKPMMLCCHLSAYHVTLRLWRDM